MNSISSIARISTPFGLSQEEFRVLSSLNTPHKIQTFVNTELRYNSELSGTETARSPRRVLRDRVAHCFEGALLAAAALRLQDHPPLVLQLTAVRDEHHLIAPYKTGNLWGAIAKTNYCGIAGRDPVYRSLRELCISYFDMYFNDRGERSLRGYCNAVNLKRFDADGWMTSEEDLFDLAYFMTDRTVIPLLPPSQVKHLTRIPPQTYRSALVGAVDVKLRDIPAPYREHMELPKMKPHRVGKTKPSRVHILNGSAKFIVRSMNL
jgi:hypothetical protein